MSIAGKLLGDGISRPEDRESWPPRDADQGEKVTSRDPSRLPTSFVSDRLAEHWSFGEPVRPGESVSGTINRFSPKDVPDESGRGSSRW